MLKILALAIALLPLGAQDEMVQRYIGKWYGTARTTTKGNYKVTAVIKRAGENLRISYTSKNAAGGLSSGNLLATSKGDGACYTANLSGGANSAIPMMADICLDESGNASITSLMANGRAVMSETGRTCTFDMKSPLGSANGTFKKALPKKKKRRAE